MTKPTRHPTTIALLQRKWEGGVVEDDIRNGKGNPTTGVDHFNHELTLGLRRVQLEQVFFILDGLHVGQIGLLTI